MLMVYTHANWRVIDIFGRTGRQIMGYILIQAYGSCLPPCLVLGNMNYELKKSVVLNLYVNKK